MHPLLDRRSLRSHLSNVSLRHIIHRMRNADHDYDVCISLADEDRPYVERVVACLKEAGVRVFYDRDERVELWGKDLFQNLSNVYSKRARYFVVFVSAAYATKPWTRHELQSAQARAFQEPQEYILPVRLDSTDLPGLLPTISYIDASSMEALVLADLILEKLRRTDFASVANPLTFDAKPTVPPSVGYSASASLLPVQPPARPILAEYPRVDAVRRRVSDPLDACERYMDTVEDLARAGRWGFRIAAAYPSELIAADDTLSQALRSFARELRSAVEEIDSVTNHRVKALGMLGAFGPFGDVRQALLAAAVATEHLRDFRDQMRAAEHRDKLRASSPYQAAVLALNRIAEKIEIAEVKREMGTALIELAMKAQEQRDS